MLELRRKSLRATGFSPFDMFHTWRCDHSDSEVTEVEEDELLRAAEQDEDSSAKFVENKWPSFVERFAEVQERVRDTAEANIAKERLRQKRSHDLRSLNIGEAVNPGTLVAKLCSFKILHTL